MFETLTIDVTNVKKILKCCPYYDDIINSDIMYNDDLSIDLIEWYKDIIFSCNGDNEEDIKVIRNIDRCMYIYINDNKYKKGLKKRIINNDINLNDNYKEVVNKILNYIVFIGAVGLMIVALIPIMCTGFFNASVSFGGTSIIIIVGVVLETMKQIESMMVNRNYRGFLSE